MCIGLKNSNKKWKNQKIKRGNLENHEKKFPGGLGSPGPKKGQKNEKVAARKKTKNGKSCWWGGGFRGGGWPARMRKFQNSAAAVSLFSS